jgi:hypothetical protein
MTFAKRPAAYLGLLFVGMASFYIGCHFMRRGSFPVYAYGNYVRTFSTLHGAAVFWIVSVGLAVGGLICAGLCGYHLWRLLRPQLPKGR